MRYVTPCAVKGQRVPPGANHNKKYDHYVMQAGLAWKLGDESALVKVDPSTVKGAEYIWELRWIDGRSVAIFQKGSVLYAQPVTDDPRARAEEKKRLKLSKAMIEDTANVPHRSDGQLPSISDVAEAALGPARKHTKPRASRVLEPARPRVAADPGKRGVRKYRTLVPL